MYVFFLKREMFFSSKKGKTNVFFYEKFVKKLLLKLVEHIRKEHMQKCFIEDTFLSSHENMIWTFRKGKTKLFTLRK